MCDWPILRLGDLVEIDKGRQTRVVPASDPLAVRYIGASDLEGVNGGRYCSAQGAVECEHSDVLMLWDGERAGLVGIGLQGAAGSTVARLRPRDDVEGRFLYHALAARFAEIRGLRTGTGVPHVPRDLGIVLKLPLPAPREQRQIAEILDTIDEAIHATTGLISKLASVRHGAVTDQMRMLMGARATSIVPLRDTVTAPICYGIVQPGSVVPGGVPMVAIRDLDGEFTNLHLVAHSLDVQHARSRVRGGDVLLSIKGTIGRTAIVIDGFSGNISRDVARLRPSSGLLPEFLEAFLRSDVGHASLSRVVVGTTRAEVSIGVLSQLCVPVPELAAQQKVVDLDAAAAGRIRAEMAYLRSLEQIRMGLARDLLSGRVRTGES